MPICVKYNPVWQQWFVNYMSAEFIDIHYTDYEAMDSSQAYWLLLVLDNGFWINIGWFYLAYLKSLGRL
jgi:hypothetical protein